MMPPKKSKRRWLILPIALLVLELIDELILYKLQAMGNVYLRVAVTMVVLTAGFALVGVVVTPALDRWLDRVFKSTGKTAGWTGMCIVAVLIVGVLYYVFLQMYSHGVGSLLPEGMRNSQTQQSVVPSWREQIQDVQKSLEEE